MDPLITLVDFILAGHDVVSTHDDYNPYIASCFTGAEGSGHGSVSATLGLHIRRGSGFGIGPGLGGHQGGTYGAGHAPGFQSNRSNESHIRDGYHLVWPSHLSR